ncbi:MAG: hypothetical protein F6K59_00655 [Moorea sp. SIO3F7]|nr:hypothetical protein [Moorena sp. SIO3E8]NEP97516.1 hypothetical protein [Moorena sp. SIO3F7]
MKQTVAPKLWKLFSEALGEKVSKTNFRSVLERRQVNQESSHTQELLGVLRQGLEPYYKGKVQSTASEEISNVPYGNHPKSQILNPQSQQLELPEGRVPLTSRFYVERVPYEFRCYEEIVKPGAFIHIKAPRQMGKTSLMVRILAHAETQGYQTVRLNLQPDLAVAFEAVVRAKVPVALEQVQAFKLYSMGAGELVRQSSDG